MQLYGDMLPGGSGSGHNASHSHWIHVQHWNRSPEGQAANQAAAAAVVNKIINNINNVVEPTTSFLSNPTVQAWAVTGVATAVVIVFDPPLGVVIGVGIASQIR